MLSSSNVIEIPASSARAFEIVKSSQLEIIDVEGQQVGDFVAFVLPDLREKFSAARTRVENGTIRITKGNRLLSNLCRTMFTIVEDTCGVHDLLYAPCCRWVFENRYKIQGHDGCLENLAQALAPWGVTINDIPDPLNVFMNAFIDDNFVPTIMPPVSKANDYITIRAETNVLIGLSACAVNVANTNAGRCKPLRVQIQTS